jgi:amidophosphoribosyltransferase
MKYKNSLTEKCGIIAISNNKNAIFNCLLGLHALQHRGHEAFGIASYDGENHKQTHRSGTVINNIKDFPRKNEEYAIGHVRYSTSGDLSFCQPISAKINLGEISIAHNGNLLGVDSMREKLINTGSILQSNVDTEIFLHLIARSEKSILLDKIIDALLQVKGAYSLVLLHNDTIFGIRDPLGIRPLVLGKMDNSYVLASETCALDIMNAKFIRDIKPGEIIEIHNDEIKSYFPFKEQEQKFCIFEYVYFARSDSLLEGRNVYEVRKSIGRQLAIESNHNTEMVIPVLDSGIASAMGYSSATGIPLELGIIRNHYAGRTFIEPTDQRRTLKVKLKHNANAHLIKNKSITLIDDSIVRGTTLKQLIIILREAGVSNIHVKISSPKMLNPCYYGVDTPNKEKLIAANYSTEEMQKLFNVDSIYFLSLEGLYKSVTGSSVQKNFCDACFSGNYPIL